MSSILFGTGPRILLAKWEVALATWVIRSGNRHFESGKLFLYRLQTKEGKGKMGSRQSILML